MMGSPDNWSSGSQNVIGICLILILPKGPCTHTPPSPGFSCKREGGWLVPMGSSGEGLVVVLLTQGTRHSQKFWVIVWLVL